MELVFHAIGFPAAPHWPFTRRSQLTEEPTMAMQKSRNVASDETSSLISSDKVEGTAVYDRRGENLGSIHSVMIDKISGKVAYAVMSSGGFLGIGDRYTRCLARADLRYRPGRLSRGSRPAQARRGPDLRRK
jgi:hypothetical protein